MSIDRRRHTRYDVSELWKLKSSLTPAPSACHLMTMSAGGCGFWSPDVQGDFGTTVKVTCHFTYEGMSTVEVKGDLLYRYPHPVNGQLGQFLGVKFDEASIELIRPVIEAIDADPQYRKEVGAVVPKKVATPRR